MRRNTVLAIIALLCIPLVYAAAAKITALTALTAAATGDKIAIVDVSDTTQAATGTSKYITMANAVYVPEVDCSANATNVAADQAMRGAVLNNYGQGAGDVVINLPTAAAGMSVLAVMGTAQAGNYWRLTAADAGTMYLDGSATGKNYVGYAATVVGNYFSCFTFRTGASAWSWICSTGAGTTVTN